MVDSVAGMKPEPNMENPQDWVSKTPLSAEKYSQITDLLKTRAFVDFIDHLHGSRSVYKDLALNWFLSICWTGVPAKSWAQTYFDLDRPHHLSTTGRLGHRLSLSLILFDEYQIGQLRHLADFFSLLEGQEFSKMFNECRQLYARSSKTLWANGDIRFGFRLAVDIFKYQCQAEALRGKFYMAAVQPAYKSSAIILPQPLYRYQ